MNKLKHTLSRLCQSLHIDPRIAVACVASFLWGIALATHSTGLQGYVLESMKQWRSDALMQSSSSRTAAVSSRRSSATSSRSRVIFRLRRSSPATRSVARSSQISRAASSSSVISRRAWVPATKSSASYHAAASPQVRQWPQQVIAPTQGAAVPAQISTETPLPVATPVSSSSEMSHPSPSPSPSPSTPKALSDVEGSTNFPAFGRTVYPVGKVPNWGAMHAAAEWNRPYDKLASEDFVPVPEYDLQKLLTPFKKYVQEDDTDDITRKLFYSTKYLSTYSLDAGEYEGTHPGVDLKLALGTPLGAIAGGRVQTVTTTKTLGLHVIIEHRIGHQTFYSVYGHLGFAAVKPGQDLEPGEFIGTVGMTGNTSAPHLHLQVDRGQGAGIHVPYVPSGVMSRAEADRWMVNPIEFIRRYAGGA